MPKLVRFLIAHGLAGIIAGWTALALIFITDVGRLGTLVFQGADWPLPLGMLMVAFGVTFGSLAIGSAVMRLGRDQGPRGDSRRWSGMTWVRGVLPPLSGSQALRPAAVRGRR